MKRTMKGSCGKMGRETRVKKALVWSLLHNEHHISLTKKERTIKGCMPIIDALFPGINFFSITGFGTVLSRCVIPVLKKRFPELKKASPKKIKGDDIVEVTEFLPSKGYEWQDDPVWKSRFNKLLKVA